MANFGWMRKRLLGLAVGTTLTVLTVVAYLAGWLAPLERIYLDYNFKHFNKLDADPRIVMIDINDLALERIERWPWPRDYQADLVDVLSESGAAAILLDLVYSEPTRPTFDDARAEPASRRRASDEILTDPGYDSVEDQCIPMTSAVQGDVELADAIRSAGNVYVAMFFGLEPPAYDLGRIRRSARALLDENPDVDVITFGNAIGPHDPSRTLLYYAHARMDRLLRQDFGLTAEDIAERLNMNIDEVRVHISRVKEVAARYLVRHYLKDHPDADKEEVFGALLPGVPVTLQSPDQKDLEIAYYAALAGRYGFAHELPASPALDGVIPNGSQPTLPIYEIAREAKQVGFVSFDKEADGVVRHIPLLARTDGHVVMQIAFALATDVLDIDTQDVRVEDERTLVLHDHAGAATWHIPLAADGTMMLNWHVPEHPVSGGPPNWYQSFTHVPVAYVWEVAHNRRTIHQNNKRLGVLLGQAVQLMLRGADAAWNDYAERVNRENQLRRRVARRHADPAAQKELEQLLAATQPVEQQALANLERSYGEIAGLEPESEDEAKLFAHVRELYSRLIGDDGIKQIEQHNRDLEARIAERLAALKEKLDGKLCFVGHTASAQADMVNTPVYDNMPGVMAHANLVNTLLENRVPRTASRAANVALILVTGLLITALASSRGPWVTLISVLVLTTATGAISSLIIWPRYIVNVAALIPIVSTFVIWALITLYRQLTEMRHRRSLTRELSRNTSPAIAAQITEQIENFELKPRPADVTCYFSDLQGFTNISERLGVERTTAILNSYLGAMGEVLIEYRAFNKFMGDGIFAFFNAPIWPVEDHARIGCEAALVTLAKLDALKRSAGNGFAAELGSLWMRIGLHTGPVFVGYFGSENQTDYTCIGDTVNLAARLESANKAFGTQVLVSGAAREAAGDGYAFRTLGALQVAGKAQAVPVFELLGRTPEVSSDRLEYAARFAEAVEAFQQQRWDVARTRFQACGAARPQDAAVGLYLSAVEQFSEAAPPTGWNQAIELRTK
ncbi:MAG: CHASE2 domain-containing protein [Phycisphaerales bacterium]|nr:CHASE2 domain-containing protein [Phycisphaerales bacterium]